MLRTDVGAVLRKPTAVEILNGAPCFVVVDPPQAASSTMSTASNVVRTRICPPASDTDEGEDCNHWSLATPLIAT
jgi:hypothetical protein